MLWAMKRESSIQWYGIVGSSGEACSVYDEDNYSS